MSALLICYLLSWSIHNYSQISTYLQRDDKNIQFKLICGSLLAGALVSQFLFSSRTRLSQNELFDFVRLSTNDRWQLEKSPVISPRVASLAHPQTFYIHAPQAKQTGVRWASNTASVAAVALGHDLFRVNLQPKEVDAAKIKTGLNSIELLVDGHSSKHEFLFVRPRVRPGKLVSSPFNGLAATVSEDTDELFILRRNGTLVRRKVRDGPSDCAVIDRKGSIAVSHRHSNELWVLESRKGLTIKQVRLYGKQTNLAVDAKLSTLAVGLAGNVSGIQFLELPALKTISHLPLDFEPDWIGFGAEADTVLIAETRRARIHRYRRIGQSWIKQAKPIQLTRPAISPHLSLDRKTLHFIVTDHHEPGDEEQNHYVKDQVMSIDLASGKVVERFPTFGAEDVDNAASLRGASPSGLAFDSSHTRATVFAGSNEVWFSDTSTRTGPYTASVSLSVPAPKSIAHLGRDVWAISYPLFGVLQLMNTNGRILREFKLETEEERDLLSQSAIKIQQGELHFNETTRSGASCESCHLNADSDYSRHDIGSGTPKPTLSVRGVAFTAPYLRGASYPSIASLEHVVLDILGGYQATAFDRGEKLEAFVNSLARRAPSREHPLEVIRKGLDAFVKARCESCHSFPHFTNLAQVSNTFLFGHEENFHWLDTPSLLSVSSSPPYLFDGRARSLDEVIGRYNSNNRHGDTAMLSDSEKEALIQMLEAL